ncbi:hypothetical protein JAAARDRAFT_62324 [Jaapia argillacea MUCL 33604]|uniref:Alcohol acetyltransferase n=1 Tax=Jaapia argillacea MUCL 33604 TaxID=933084 RepID=A0A067PAJ5_9AGAM|nr:hypothetical protein JAAARDRAFT_62324 [Jaapia argillacea MUCL 33604]
MEPTPSNSFSWAKAQPGSIDIPGCDPSAIDRSIWFRRQTALESGSSVPIITSIRLSPPRSTSHELTLYTLKAAVRQLRFDHPAIASKHGWSTQPHMPEHAVFAYEVPGTESAIDTWLSEVVLDRTDVLLASDGDVEKAVETITYDLGKPGSSVEPLFLLNYIPAASPNGHYGLVFLFSHAVFDAVGCFQIMDLCVSRIADSLATGGRRTPLAWGEETSRLPPALVESARIPYTADKVPEDEFMIQKVKEALQSFPNIHKIPISHPQASSTATGLLTRIASPDLLTKLRTAARAHGCTIYTVLLASMALTSIRLWPPDDTTNVTLPSLYSPVDIRSLACGDRLDKSQWKVRLSLGFNTYVARDLGRFVGPSNDGGGDLNQDVWVLAKELRAQVEEQKKYTERMAVWIDGMLAALSEGLMGVLGDEPATPSKGYPILSSIGVMDEYLARSHPVATGGQLVVSSPRLSPRFYDVLGGGCLALHAFTWEGELMMAFTFPEGVMGSPQDQEIALEEGRKGDAISLQFVNEYMNILDVASRSK